MQYKKNMVSCEKQIKKDNRDINRNSTKLCWLDKKKHLENKYSTEVGSNFEQKSLRLELDEFRPYRRRH